MKRLLYTLLTAVLVTGCGYNDHAALANMSRAEQLLWTHPDSALFQLKRTPLEGPLSPHVRARHALLTVQARSRMRIPATSDSLIRIALDYYQCREYYWPDYLLRTYLYHADVMMDMGRNDAATVSLKKAESLIRWDTPLPYRFLIQSNLGYINRRSGLYTHAYKHHRTAYELAEMQQDTLWMMTALANLMTLRGYDTTALATRYTYTKLERITPALPDYLQGKLWQNAGVWYCDRRDTLTALRCYHRALSVDTTQTSTWLMLGLLYEKQGNILAVDTIYPKILAQGTASQVSVAHQLLSEKHQKNNDFIGAARHYRNYQAAAQQVIAARDTRKILELQAEHERLKAAYREYHRTTLLVSVILVLTVFAIVIILQGRRIIRRHRMRLEKQMEANAVLEEMNGTLNARVGHQQKYLNQYKTICHIDEGYNRIRLEDLAAMNIALLIGHDNYVLQGESDYAALYRWSDIACRDYASRMKRDYPDLKPYELATCCLLRQGYTIADCARIMGTHEATVRKRIQRMYAIFQVKDRQEYLNLVLEVKNNS